MPQLEELTGEGGDGKVESPVSPADWLGARSIFAKAFAGITQQAGSWGDQERTINAGLSVESTNAVYWT